MSGSTVRMSSGAAAQCARFWPGVQSDHTGSRHSQVVLVEKGVVPGSQEGLHVCRLKHALWFLLDALP